MKWNEEFKSNRAQKPPYINFIAVNDLKFVEREIKTKLKRLQSALVMATSIA